jgi:endonuclease/exonuclease/phosphatase family metal-dependent hydrolase
VGVHFQSGYPVFTDADDASKRKKQCRHLADWIAGQKAALNPRLPMPLPDEHVAILGDLNALYDSDEPAYAGVVASLNPLREGHMAGWWWQKPLADPAGGGRTSSYLEDLLIDFVLLSPSLKERIIQPPTIYAFDHDPAIGVAGERVSDHRPVFVEIDISPSS